MSEEAILWGFSLFVIGMLALDLRQWWLKEIKNDELEFLFGRMQEDYLKRRTDRPVLKSKMSLGSLATSRPTHQAG